MLRCTKTLLLTLFLVLFVAIGWAQAATKDINLNDGWNLVNTSIQPSDPSADNVLTGMNYISAWKWVGHGWAVNLGSGSTSEYAQQKGFQTLSTINAGEGFWLNMNGTGTLSINGDSPSSSSIYYNNGWNLCGLKQSGSKNVTDLFPEQGVSAWAWSSTGWNVYLPTGLTEYAQSKGFGELGTVSDSDGFWVNAGSSDVYEGPTETPPQVGKAYTAGVNNQFNPLANAEVFIEDAKVGVTDDQGKFAIPAGTAENAEVEIKADGYTVGIGTVQNGVVFVQKLDPQETELTSNYNATSGSFELPTNKVLSSADGKTNVVVGTDMQLKKDITVQLTTYNTPVSAPAYKALGNDNIEAGKDITPSLVVLGGASMEVFDSDGMLTSLKSDEFDATIQASSTQILGGIGEALNAYTKPVSAEVEKIIEDAYAKFNQQLSSGKMSLYTMVYDPSTGTWDKAGSAVVKPYTISKKIFDDQGDFKEIKEYTKYALTTGKGVSLPTFAPFAFVLKYENLIGEIAAKVVEGGYKMSDGSIVTSKDSNSDDFDWVGQPVEGVMAVGDEDVAMEAAMTKAAGEVTLSYKTPYMSPVIDLNFKKEGYFDASIQVNVLDYYQEDFPTKTLKMYRIPDTASLEGYVREKVSNDPIGGALVSLMNPDVLDEIKTEQDDTLGSILTVEKKPNAEYLWEYRKQSDAPDGVWTELNTTETNQISTSLVRNALIEDFNATSSADPTGSYDLRVTVTHKYDNDNDSSFETEYVEEALGHFEIVIDQNKLKQAVTGSLSEAVKSENSQYGLYGGSSLGWYEFAGTIANEYELKWTTAIQAAATEAMFNDPDTYPNVVQDELASTVLNPVYVNVLFESEPYVDAFYPYPFVMGYLTKNFMTLLEEDPNNNEVPFFESGFTVKNTANYKFKGGDGNWQEIQAASYFDLPENAITDAKLLLLIPELEIMPNTTFAYLRQIYSKDDGFYRFNLVPYEYNEKLEIAGEKQGYAPDYKFVNDLAKGKVSHYDLYLEAFDVPAQEILFTYEGDKEAEEGVWTAANPDNAVKWQYLSNPESVSVDPAFVDYADYPDEVTDSDVYTDYEAQLKKDNDEAVIWTDESQNKATLIANSQEYPVYAYLDDAGNIDQVESVDPDQGEAWIDANGNLMFTIMSDGTPKVTLLPAYEGSRNLWFGNTANGVFKEGTSTSGYIYQDSIESPVLDLTEFSFATLNFKTWFEAESVDIAQGMFDQMLIEATVVNDTQEDMTIKSPSGSYTLTPGQWKKVGTMNPSSEPGWQNQSAKLNFSSAGPDSMPLWIKKSVNLHPFAGHKIKLRFSFYTKDGLFNYFRGWAIDYLQILNEIQIELPPTVGELPSPDDGLSRKSL